MRVFVAALLLSFVVCCQGHMPSAFTSPNHPNVRDSDFFNPQQQYWWVFPSMDCSNDDLSANCFKKSVEECKQICLKTAGCGGFNSNGFLKKTDCSQKMAASASSQVSLYLLEDVPQEASWEAWPPVFPHPFTYSNGSDTLVVNNFELEIHAVNISSDLKLAFERFKQRLFTHRVSNEKEPELSQRKNVIRWIEVVVEDPEAELQLEADESYVLRITEDGEVQILAATQFGVYHALESFSQLVAFNFDAQEYLLAGAPWVIDDAPRFKHRELLIDSSRHFQPVRSILNMVDSMTYAKLNVLHWHLVDHQSFPFDSPSRPLLGKRGAYSPSERYTSNDVADVVEYARQRGVRVVVEIDQPGHASSWCNGYPSVCPSLQCTSPLNPANEDTFDLITDLFRDLTSGERGRGLFFDNMLHLGGDEVDMSCWNNPEIQKWMNATGLKDLNEVYFYFVNRSQAIGRSMGRDVVGWEEIWNTFGTTLDKSTVVQIWLSAKTAKSVAENNYRLIFSPYPNWYLDYLDVTWAQMYLTEPCNDIPDEQCDRLVLGGGGEMWGETVDISDIQQTVWPRLAAIAERLWSPRTLVNTALAEPRIANFRCLLNKRGVGAAPVTNSHARSAPVGPGGCYAQ